LPIATERESVTLRVEAEQIAAVACLPQPGHQNTVLGDPEKVQRLLASLRDGNYREIACRQAGIAKQTFYYWLKRAETGEEAAMALLDAVERAEAEAEAETVGNVRRASKLPQFWAAGMTYLERKSPDRWGRRGEDSNTPKIVVQIGVKDGDVQVQIAGAGQNPPAIEPHEPTEYPLNLEASLPAQSHLIVGRPGDTT